MTELQNYRMTELQNDRQDKNNMPPDLRSRGHKNSIQNFCFHISSVIFKMTERSKLYKWQKLVVKCKCCRFYTIICNYKLNKHTS